MFLGQGGTVDWANSWYMPKAINRAKCENLVHIHVANSRKGSHEFDETITLQGTILMMIRLLICMCSLYVCVSLLVVQNDCDAKEQLSSVDQEMVHGISGSSAFEQLNLNDRCDVTHVPWQRFLDNGNTTSPQVKQYGECEAVDDLLVVAGRTPSQQVTNETAAVSTRWISPVVTNSLGWVVLALAQFHGLLTSISVFVQVV
jgi:hypothetical protein